MFGNIYLISTLIFNRKCADVYEPVVQRVHRKQTVTDKGGQAYHAPQQAHMSVTVPSDHAEMGQIGPYTWQCSCAEMRDVHDDGSNGSSMSQGRRTPRDTYHFCRAFLVPFLSSPLVGFKYRPPPSPPPPPPPPKTSTDPRK